MKKYIILIEALIQQYKERYTKGNFWDMVNFLEIEMHGEYDVEDDAQWDAFNNAMLLTLISLSDERAAPLVERFGSDKQMYAFSDWEKHKMETDQLAHLYAQGSDDISLEEIKKEQQSSLSLWNQFLETLN